MDAESDEFVPFQYEPPYLCGQIIGETYVQAMNFWKTRTKFQEKKSYEGNKATT